ncbi:MAG: hypothetical protein ACTSYS_00350 [Promethearchaeota archaeon]
MTLLTGRDEKMKIHDINSNQDDLKSLEHLVQYMIKPVDLPGEYEFFRVREIFPAGKLLCGDLVVNETSSKQLEIHPFPEWVVQVIQPAPVEESLPAYCVFLNLNKKQLKKISKMSTKEKKSEIKELVKSCTNNDIIAFKMAPGACVKVNPNVPHYFITEKSSEGKSIPYALVFEPSIDWEAMKIFGKFESTAYFSLPFDLQVENL